MYKAYKFRMYLTLEQKHLLNSFMGSSRFIYNYYLDKKIKMYKKDGISYSLKDMKANLKVLQKDYQWLKNIDGCVLRTTLEDLDRAYINFFKTAVFQNLNPNTTMTHIVPFVLEALIKIIVIQI